MWSFTCASTISRVIVLKCRSGSGIWSLIRVLDRKLKNHSKMTNRNKEVLITRPDIAPIGIELLKIECNVFTWDKSEPMPREELLCNIVGKHGLFCSLSDKIDVELLDRAGPQLKCVSTISVGYDHIDVGECKKRSIRVGYTPDVLTDATAELTVALLLATSRRLLEANKEVYNGGWKSWSPNWMCGQGLKGSRVGIFGFGRIGQEVAARIKPFKPRMLTYTSRKQYQDRAKEVGAVHVDFDEMLCKSDFIIVCCSLTEDTKEIFNADSFSKMSSNLIFINSSRGGVVDQSALFHALKEKRIKAAGLDVTTPEPLPLSDPLLELDNVVILPHIGSADKNTRIEMSRITAANILAALNDEAMIAEI